MHAVSEWDLQDGQANLGVAFKLVRRRAVGFRSGTYVEQADAVHAQTHGDYGLAPGVDGHGPWALGNVHTAQPTVKAQRL